MTKHQREIVVLILIVYVGGEIAIANYFFWHIEVAVSRIFGLK